MIVSGQGFEEYAINWFSPSTPTVPNDFSYYDTRARAYYQNGITGLWYSTGVYFWAAVTGLWDGISNLKKVLTLCNFERIYCIYPKFYLDADFLTVYGQVFLSLKKLPFLSKLDVQLYHVLRQHHVCQFCLY